MAEAMLSKTERAFVVTGRKPDGGAITPQYAKVLTSGIVRKLELVDDELDTLRGHPLFSKLVDTYFPAKPAEVVWEEGGYEAVIERTLRKRRKEREEAAKERPVEKVEVGDVAFEDFGKAESQASSPPH